MITISLLISLHTVTIHIHIISLLSKQRQFFQVVLFTTQQNLFPFGAFQHVWFHIVGKFKFSSCLGHASTALKKIKSKLTKCIVLRWVAFTCFLGMKRAWFIFVFVFPTTTTDPTAGRAQQSAAVARWTSWQLTKQHVIHQKIQPNVKWNG